MFVPTYVARKVGDEFVVVRVDPGGTLIRTAALAAGVGLIGLALARRGVLAGLAAAGGAALAYHGWTGQNLVKRLLGDRPREGDDSQTPSYRNDGGTGSSQVPADPLEEAQMESFPASDPPASTRP